MKKSCVLVLLGLVATAAEARTTAYAIAIGNNAPPAHGGAGLSALSYADDDAVRYYQFFSRFADEARLLSVLDVQTQRRYPQLVGVAQPPTVEALRSAVRLLAARVQADIKRGDQPVVYLAFSGHGAQLPDGTAFLALADGELTRAMLQRDVLTPLSAAFVNLFVDACHAEGVVGSRGLFDHEHNARTTGVSDGDAARLAEAASLHFPRVGTLVATTEGQESHEWSQIQSGVFTHELLSGLAGAADANGDGVVEYGEIQAFLTSANRDVQDPRARPHVVAYPPSVNPRLPIVSLSALRGVAFLVGDFAPLGHFHIELENGERYADANLSSELQGRIAFPANRQAFLVARDREAALTARPGETRSLGSLHFRSKEVAARGSVEASLRDGLFASAFGLTYNRGFLDGVSLAPDSAQLGIGARASEPGAYRKPLAISAFVVSGLSLAAAVTTTALALKARSDYQATQIQRSASEAQDRFSRYRTAAVVTGAGAVITGVTGWLLWPRSEAPAVATPLLLGHGVGLAVQGGW